MKFKMEVADPNRASDRKLRLEPRATQFATDIAKASRENERKLMLLPKIPAPITERVCTEPNFAIPSMDNPLPIRTNERTDKLLPPLQKSSTETLAPKRANPRTDIELPRCT
jgi:hypothetical protein